MVLPGIQEYLVFSFLNPTSYMKACPFVVSLFYLEDLGRQIGNQYGKNNANSEDNRKSPYRIADIRASAYPTGISLTAHL